MIWSIVAAAAFVTATLALERYLVWRTKQLQLRARCREMFFEHANRALSHESLPEEARRIIVIATLAIDSTKTAYGILRMALNGELSREDADDDKQVNALAKVMAEVEPDVRDAFYHALTSWVFAVTFNTALFGWVLRRLVFHSVRRDPHQAEQVIYHFKDSDKNHHNGAVAA